MPDARTLVPVFAILLCVVLSLQAERLNAQAAADVSAEPVEAVVDETERARVHEELQQREAERDQQRKQICEQARAEIERLGNLPGRWVMKSNEDGTQSRMTQEEHAAHIEKMRAAEAENCQ